MIGLFKNNGCQLNGNNIGPNSRFQQLIITDMQCTRIYQPTNHRAIYSCRFPVGEGNNNGVGGIVLSCRTSSTPGAHNTTMLIATVNNNPQNSNSIPVSSITNEAVGTGDGTTTKFKTKFDCPENAKVYINGIEQTSGVIVRKLPQIPIVNNSLNNGVRKYWMALDASRSTTNFFYRVISLIYGQQGTSSVTFFDKGIQIWAEPEICYYNPFYQDIGVTGVKWSDQGGQTLNRAIYASNDLVNWEVAAVAGESGTYNSSDSSYTGTFNPLYKNYKFFKCTPALESYSSNNQDNPHFEEYKGFKSLFVEETYDGNNIIFDVPPAAGDIITIDYDTQYLAKDSDHVLDIAITVNYGPQS